MQPSRQQEQAMVQIALNNMIIIQILVSSLLCGFVAGRPCTTCLPPQQQEGQVRGNLKLHYSDSSTFRIDYDSSSKDCRVDNLWRKKIAKVVVNAAKFILYSSEGWRGTSAKVHSVGRKEYSVEQINGITRVKSVKQYRCKRR